MEPSWSDCGLFGIEQPREPFAHITGLVEMVGHALRAPAHRECQAVKIGHDGEHRFVGDIVADKIGRRPLKGSWVINSSTPVALLKPECFISQTHFPGSTSIGALGRSALIRDTAA